MTRTQWDAIIVGAGPAGMAAAIELRRRKLDVLVLDRQQEPGGQVWRRAGSAPQELVGFLGGEYEEGRNMAREFQNSGAEFSAGAQVWHLLPQNAYVSIAGKSMNLRARQILIATGAMERPVPVPGWTLPGVLGAGAADVLLKSGGMTFEGPVVLCGNGPLILQTLDHLLRLKVGVSGVVLTGAATNAFKAVTKLHGIAARPLYFMHGAGMGLRGAMARVPFYPGSSAVSIAKEGGVFKVCFRSLGKERSLEGATVLLHEGIVSEQCITRL
ncbi:MAG: FAD-dependent oxidoreductase, partial [Mailhella sp.]|nr:FAD-dependent oxidoreductase [Mailhella sp.]